VDDALSSNNPSPLLRNNRDNEIKRNKMIFWFFVRSKTASSNEMA